MILILEIVLTVMAWRRGWKGWALVPMAVALFVGFLWGAVAAASGGSMQDIWGASLLVDLALIGTLIAMVAHPRTEEPRIEARSADQPEELVFEPLDRHPSWPA